jgi:RNA recognition motif-containing protein
MNNKLFVGQLSFSVSSEELGQFFSECGQVLSSKVITDRDSGRSKGFGFVEMGTDEEAQAAIDKLNGKELNGRTITVAVAKPQEKRSGGGGGRGFGGGGGGGRGFGGGGGGGGRGGFGGGGRGGNRDY